MKSPISSTFIKIATLQFGDTEKLINIHQNEATDFAQVYLQLTTNKFQKRFQHFYCHGVTKKIKGSCLYQICPY